MATGKTTSLYTTVLLDNSGGSAQDITASVSSISGIGLENGEVDVTVLSDTAMQFLPGRGDSTIELSGPFNNTASTGSHIVLGGLSGTSTAATLTVKFGIRAAATTGDPKWEGEYVVTRYTVDAAVSGEVTWTARLRPAFGTSAPAWGTV